MTFITMAARAALSRGITAQRLGKNVTFYVNDLVSPVSERNHSSVDSKPLLLMLPWLGSRPQSVAKYCDIYFRSGFDVLVVQSEVKEFLWPKWSLERGKSLLELLESDRFESRELFVHAFSIGGYTFAQLLVHILQDEQKHQALTQRIRGQVYDSLVVGSIERMVLGVWKTQLPRMDWAVVRRASLLYFDLLKNYTVSYYNTAIDAFWNTPITAPALFFFCENDPMSDQVVLEEILDYWQNRGIDTTGKKWKDSTHAGHLKRHPEEYQATLNAFLHKVRQSPLRAKM